MDPSMMMYLLQQQQAQQQPPMADSPDPTGGFPPLNPAALAAMKAAKQSLGMDEEEQRRAMGLAIMRFFSGMGKPGYGGGLQGALQGVNENLGPALETYQNEANRVEQQNAALMQYATEAQERQNMLRSRMIEKAQLEAHRQAQQKETERHNRAQEQYSQGMLGLKSRKLEDGGQMNAYQRDKLEHQKNLLAMQMKTAERAQKREKQMEEAMDRGEIPLESLDPSARSKYQQTAQKKIDEIIVNERAIDTINKMKKIFEKHPRIGSSWLQTLNGKGESSLKNIFFRKMADPKELAALESLTKYGSDLGLSVIYSVPAKQATDLLKNMINNAGPNGKLSKGAFDRIADDWLQRANSNIRLAKKYEDSLRRRSMVSSEDMENVENPYKNISDEELLELYKQSGQSE